MKNHIVFKFLALVLCAAMLFTAVVAGFGIFALNEAGLYQKSWEDAYDDYRHDILMHTANAIAARYAAIELGGLSERMADQYYGEEWYLRQFRFGTMGYTLYDSEKNPLKTYAMTGHEPVEGVILDTTQQEYPKLVAVVTPEERDAALGITQPTEIPRHHTIGSATLFDAIPQEGAEVHMISLGYPDSSEGVGSPDGLGWVEHNEEGRVLFRSYERSFLDMSDRSNLISITFESEQLGLLYELSDPQGIGLLYSDPDGYIHFEASIPSPNFAPEIVAETSMPEPTEEPAPNATIDPAELHIEYNGFSSGANIYAAPHEEAEVLGTLTDEDMALSFREYRVDDRLWYLFEKGWVMAEPVAASEQADTPVGPVRTVNIYYTPNADAAPVGTLAVGAELTPIRTVNVKGEDWLLIPEGWLLQSELEAATAQAPETTGETTGATEATAASSPEETAEPAAEKTVEPTAEETMEPAATEIMASAVAETMEPAAEESMPEETIAPTMEKSVPEETMEPQALPRQLQPNGQYLTYYDPELRQDMVLQYTMEQAPAYTVVFQLAENALNGDYGWRLLALASNFREYLVPALIGSILLFAILMVYLCCAAGHKPGTAEIRAGGLNRFPLDGWIIVLCVGLTGAAVMGVEGTEYLMRGSMELGIAFAAAVGYGAALLMVCFCFAFAAQVKTPGGFWWRNSLCGWCWRLFVWCLAWCIKAVRVLWQWFLRFCSRFAKLTDEKLAPWSVRFFLGLWKCVRAVAAVIGKWCSALLRTFLRLCDWLGARLVRFIAMLPMTWQWLLTGFGIIIVLALTVNSSAAIWGICLTIALVLYGTHAFGTLLEAVKRMNKGDLDDKVEDKLLVGSFRDFAGELNGLADVAVVAAQKQLKSERMKTELITNVSHDIKTPLTSIINYVDLLEKPHTPEEQEVYLEVLSRQSQRLKKLIEDLMEMSKASTGNMNVDIRTVDAVEAVNQSLGEFADKLEKAQLIPVFRQPEETVEMLADGRLVWRVMSNLLGNAVKYALPGTRIYLDLAKVEDKVIISLKNISREELNVSADELLERFVRGDASRNTEGSGLGLNIARSLMELQKGQLQLLVDGDLFKVTLIFPAA